jgi:hypothetical protein
MSDGFCVHCGNPMMGVPSDWVTCKNPQCIRKLGLFCDKVADQFVALCYPYGEPEGDTKRREFRDMVWQRVARPVTAPDHSIRGIGNLRAAGVLPSLLLKDGTVPAELDGDMYGRLVANGWVEFSAHIYQSLLARETGPTA